MKRPRPWTLAAGSVLLALAGAAGTPPPALRQGDASASLFPEAAPPASLVSMAGAGWAPPVTEAAAVTAPCAPGPSARLDFLTYNVGLQRVPVAGDIIPYVDARLRELSAHLPAYLAREGIEVLVLNEVMLPEHAAVLRGALAAAGYDTWRPGRVFPFLAASGVMVAVRRGVPVRRVQFVPFERRAKYELVAFRGMLVLTLEPLPGGPPLTVIGTHIQSNPSDDDPDAVAAQWSQFRQTGRVLAAETFQGRGAAVFLGDLNIEPSDDRYRLLVSEVGLEDAWEAARPGEPGHTISPENPLTQENAGTPLPRGMRIDFVMHRSGAAAALRTLDAEVAFNRPVPAPGRPLWLSDHYAVGASLLYTACR